MKQVLVVDDEGPARARLIRMLSRYPDLRVIDEAGDGASALQKIERLKPDLVFLDVEMPEANGIEVVERLTSHIPQVIFVTGYTEYAIRAFEVSAIDYLLKPVAESRLDAAVEKLRKTAALPSDDFSRLLAHMAEEKAGRRLAVKCGAKYVVFDPSLISAVVATDHYSTICVNGKELLTDESLETLESKLSSKQFIRIHRGALINVNYLQELQRDGDRKYTAILNDPKKTQHPVSRERLSELKTILGIG